MNTTDKNAPPGITRISVAGFKSIVDWQSIEIRPLTILAGANNSGKSSIMQPLLLLKQTLDARVTPRLFELEGSNVSYTEYQQFFSRAQNLDSQRQFSVKFELNTDTILFSYLLKKDSEPAISALTLAKNEKSLVLKPDSEYLLTNPDVRAFFPSLRRNKDKHVYLKQELFYFSLIVHENEYEVKLACPLLEDLKHSISHSLHIPGARPGSQRLFKFVKAGINNPGFFSEYVASILLDWKEDDRKELTRLCRLMERLGLASLIDAKPVTATRVEISVGRKQAGSRQRDAELVNIADVGTGTSQVLPILVALLMAKPDQLVYIEEPELHLHPKAQWELAKIMAETANRGVRLVVETHSSIIVRGVQTLVAKGELPPDNVALHWFHLDDAGKTQVHSAQLDQNGAYGDWPEDFDETALMVEEKYYEAVEKRMFGHG